MHWVATILPLFFTYVGAGFHETIAEDGLENSLTPILEKHLEPFGAVCIAYVDSESKNHLLLRKMGRLEESKEDVVLANLQVPVVLALNWFPGNESLTMMYRKPFQQMWSEVGMTAMDEHDVTFAAPVGVPWKQGAVRKWLAENAFPTINVRVLGRKEDIFPEWRYMHPAANTKAAALVFMNMTGDKEVSSQLRLAIVLRKQAERLKDKVRFSFVERTKETRRLRQDLGIGVDMSFEAEMILIERPGFYPADQHDLNHWHGDPKKYRLRNFTAEAVDAFFEAFERGLLPTHWASLENSTLDGPPPSHEVARRLTGLDFESVVYDTDPKQARIVAFFNDNPEHNCMRCADGRTVWESVARAVQGTRSLADKVLVASIDQSLNQHPETSIAAKIAQPMIVWYPAGSRKHRLRKRRVLAGVSASFTREAILEEIEDILLDARQGDEM